jgi:hypothetical protein
MLILFSDFQMKTIHSLLLSACLLAGAPAIHAQTALLEQALAGRDISALLVPTGRWVRYPAYSDRAAWDRLTGDRKAELIKAGEAYLKYEWKVVRATDYLAFERTGNRVVMQDPFGANNNAVMGLFLAELAEGKGRFLDALIDGVWHTCEMSTWVLSAHLPVQRSKRSLPETDEMIIDLTSGDLGSMMSWIHHFLSEEFDRVNPVISKRVRKEVKERILDPYLSRSDLWWMALQGNPNQMVNNWNPWCNFNMLACFLLMEQDPARRAEGVKKSILSTDRFIRYTKDDGACEEGPSYWGHAAGKLYDYLQLLSYATGGRVDIFQHPKIRSMGEYIARSYIGDGWVVNFADASAKGGGNPGVIHRFGKAVGSSEMTAFAAWLERRNPSRGHEERDAFRALETLQSFHELKATAPQLPASASSWYPQTEFCYMRAGDAFFGGKGGYNAESHNHNDVGSFIYFLRQKPILVDAGVGTYTRFTFGSQRYTIWTMQSDYHNLPRINGFSQKDGREFRSKQAAFDSAERRFSLDIAGAYLPDAAVNAWRIDYRLSPEGSLYIQERFELDAVKEPSRLQFLSAVEPVEVSPGVLQLHNGDAHAKMEYDPKVFAFSYERVGIDDTRLSNVWGKALYRLIFTDKKPAKKGSYRISIRPS